MLRKIIIILICMVCLAGCDEEETQTSTKDEFLNNLRDIKDQYDGIKNEIEDTKNEIYSIFGNNTESSKQEESTNNEKQQDDSEYIKATFDDMISLLEENALKAKKTYEDKIVEVTGILVNIDSDGKYIGLGEINNKYSIRSLLCEVCNEDQLNYVLDMKKGNKYTIKVRITSVGEVLGYSGDIVDFVN